jgi:hypothetical protein
MLAVQEITRRIPPTVQAKLQLASAAPTRAVQPKLACFASLPAFVRVADEEGAAERSAVVTEYESHIESLQGVCGVQAIAGCLGWWEGLRASPVATGELKLITGGLVATGEGVVY